MQLMGLRRLRILLVVQLLLLNIGVAKNLKDFTTPGGSTSTSLTTGHAPAKTYYGDFERWRDDGRCGGRYPLPDGREAECDPDSERPCCGYYGLCGNRDDQCNCPSCTDYRIVRKIAKSENSCIITAVGGFLKKVCGYDEIKSRYYFMCTHSNVSYEIHFQFDTSSFSFALHSVSAVCENDPHSYQSCGFNTRITDTDVLCGGYFCSEDSRTYSFSKCADNCGFDLRNCSRSRDEAYTDIVDLYSVCDGKCDDSFCKDESHCNGYRYGVFCTVGGGYMHIPAQGICLGYSICDNGEDEQDCNVSDSTPHTCSHYGRMAVMGEGVTVPILNYTRCTVFDVVGDNHPYCLNYLDQTNCSDIERVGGWCHVNGFLSSVSIFVVCHDYDTQVGLPVQLCDDGMENVCISPSSSVSCRVHKHRMCDGVSDCSDGSDEYNDICITMTTAHKCQRTFGPRMMLSLPVSWIMDNQTDCIDGLDEGRNDGWLFCGDTDSGTLRVKLNYDYIACQNVFLCPQFKIPYVHLDLLCDGVESCGIENRVCGIARDFPIINKTVLNYGSVKDVCRSMYVPKGDSCVVTEFTRPLVNVFGAARIRVNVPSTKVDCSHIFGEYYVFLSCMGLCINSAAACPLDNNPRPLLHDSCPGQYPNRIYTLANDSYLTFVTETYPEGQYEQNYFQCNNSRCVEYKQVCDLIDDCGDFSDEINCTNHRICGHTVGSYSHRAQLISLQQTCDGIFDCYDLSDECNEHCGREILGHWLLKCVCWLMGILAILFNAVAMIKTTLSLKDCQSTSLLVLYNKALVSLIGLGDLLVGIYLILLSVYDSIVFGRSFCSHQAEWLTSSTCSALGVISTIGSQLSLFSMTALSIVRFVALLSPSMSIPNQVNKQTVLKVLPSMITIIATSFVVALIPLAPSLEDYFVQGMYYEPAYKVFIGFQNKVKHLKVLQAYYNSTNITPDLTWNEIGSLVDGMFSQNYGRIGRSAVHFYGNDGVCLFKYFVRSDDPRRSRNTLEAVTTQGKGDEMVWLMLLVNFLCFVVITVLYILISIKTRQSSGGRGQYHGLDQEKQSRVLQRRITILIATDFLCWIPFIVFSSLHNLLAIDATHWYVPFAMTVLPLNSVINPLIYDSTIHDFLRRKWRLMQSGNCRGNDSTRGTRLVEEDTRAGENIGMGTIQTAVQD